MTNRSQGFGFYFGCAIALGVGGGDLN